MKPSFLFSIIMAVRDGAEFLPRALDALTAQTYAQWELVVQDAESGDATRELLAARNDARIKVVSQADSGVYQAWNRALERISGEWVMFLGADDVLAAPHVLAQAARALAQLPEAALFAQGGLQLGKRGEVRDTIARSKAEIFRFFINGMPLLTPAVFFRRRLFTGLGGRFDESYEIAGDFAFVAERLSPDNLALLPFVVTYMESGGLSSSLRTRPILEAERKRVLEQAVLPRAAEIVQACIDTYSDTVRPL